jgi:hypothetical protein
MDAGARHQNAQDVSAILALLDAPAPAGVTIKPLVWEYHPAGAIAAPPTGHAYIIDTRMKGRVYSLKGFNPAREFGSIDEAKAAAQADYEARIMAALETAPAGVTVPEWQPIETAPSAPVLFYGNTRHDTGVAFTGWKAQNGRCYADSGDSVKATHWMPMPAPPSALSGDRT